MGGWGRSLQGGGGGCAIRMIRQERELGKYDLTNTIPSGGIDLAQVITVAVTYESMI